MYVFYVYDKNKLNHFFKLGAYNFFYSLHDERRHPNLSNGEGPMPIDALGAHFWAIFRPNFAQKLTLRKTDDSECI